MDILLHLLGLFGGKSLAWVIHTLVLVVRGNELLGNVFAEALQVFLRELMPKLIQNMLDVREHLGAVSQYVS
jgi:hypothetical protein